ncbi:TniQ family protein [Pseudomonas caspiana]|uniref:TniQ family protein n=1 Tax=Pseudomonas caspiana TaxID=1451454 RepID=UPI0013024C56|nr:TniQ family protein [Pseudomonas caspiana]
MFIPKPFPEESPSSVLKRMAIRHGCIAKADLQSLFGDALRHESIMSRTHPAVQAIATMSGWDAKQFLSGFYEPVGPLLEGPPLIICGLVVRADMVRKQQTAFCSECWAAGHEHFIKDLKLAVYCPYHLRRYLAKCPNCGTELRWSNLLSGKCRCAELPISPTCTSAEALIEIKLLQIFRERDTDRFDKFNDYLRLLGFHTKDPTECSAVRTIVALAFALLETNQKAILYHLGTLHTLYPEIPRRIISAKLSLIPAKQCQDCVKIFLRHSFSTDTPFRECTTPLISSFELTSRQISNWQKLASHQWRIVRKNSNILSSIGRYRWQEVQKMTVHILQLKLNNGFSQKKAISGMNLGELKKELLLSKVVLRGAIDEKLLHPISWRTDDWLFDPTDIANFCRHYISVHMLSANTKIPVDKIRRALRHLGLRNSEFKSQRVRLHVMSIETSKAVIEWCTPHTKKYEKRTQSWTSLPQHDPNDLGVWLSASAAAELVGCWPAGLRRLIEAKLIPATVGGNQKNGYLVKEKELIKFKIKYISASEATKLLSCKQRHTSAVLRKAGIKPVTGPGIDKNPTYYYLRLPVLEFIHAMKELPRTKEYGLTHFEACRHLHLPIRMIALLINSGALETIETIDNFSNPIKKKSVDDFYDHYASASTIAGWLNIPLKCVDQALLKFGISTIPGVSTDSFRTHLYKIDDVANVFLLPSRPNSTGFKSGKLLILENISSVREKYQISAVPFFRLFIASGFVSRVGNYQPAYLLESDVIKISQIMEKYCIISQADKYLGHTQLANNLVKTKKLSVSHPLLPYTNYPMIERAILRDYALKNHLI